MTLTIHDYFEQAGRLCKQVDTVQVEQLIQLLLAAREQGQHIFICGNGGSAANASHFCEDLGKGTLRSLDDTQRFKVISLTDNTPYITAWANDNGYATVYEQQLRNLAEAGDLLIAISGSGNSENVLRAIQYANDHGMTTVGMTGQSGGKLASRVHHLLSMPTDDMGMLESLHLVVVHAVLAVIYPQAYRS